jgi:hypothetical protein
MQVTNRKEIAIKTLLILISILSIILIKEGISAINSSINLIENMGGFDLYPIDSNDTTVQGWYYQIITDVIFTLCPIVVLILSIVSIFVKNRIVEITIIAQTFLTLLLEATAHYRFIGETIGYYTYIGIALLITLTPIILSAIKKKSVFVFYIIGFILLTAKYIDVFKFWYGRVRGDMSLFSWFDMYGLKYAVISILGFCILMLKQQKQSN